MEDLIGEIYFSKRQNVSLKDSLVMHKSLLSSEDPFSKRNVGIIFIS